MLAERRVVIVHAWSDRCVYLRVHVQLPNATVVSCTHMVWRLMVVVLFAADCEDGGSGDGSMRVQNGLFPNTFGSDELAQLLGPDWLEMPQAHAHAQAQAANGFCLDLHAHASVAQSTLFAADLMAASGAGQLHYGQVFRALLLNHGPFNYYSIMVR